MSVQVLQIGPRFKKHKFQEQKCVCALIVNVNKGACLWRALEMLGMRGLLRNGVNTAQGRGVSSQAGERSSRMSGHVHDEYHLLW